MRLFTGASVMDRMEDINPNTGKEESKVYKRVRVRSMKFLRKFFVVKGIEFVSLDRVLDDLEDI